MSWATAAPFGTGQRRDPSVAVTQDSHPDRMFDLSKNDRGGILRSSEQGKARRGGERTGQPLLDSRTNTKDYGRVLVYCQDTNIHGAIRFEPRAS